MVCQEEGFFFFFLVLWGRIIATVKAQTSNNTPVSVSFFILSFFSQHGKINHVYWLHQGCRLRFFALILFKRLKTCPKVYIYSSLLL